MADAPTHGSWTPRNDLVEGHDIKMADSIVTTLPIPQSHPATPATHSGAQSIRSSSSPPSSYDLSTSESRGHGVTVLSRWRGLLDIVEGSNAISVDGKTLDISRVVAVARYGASVKVSEEEDVIESMNESVKFLHDELNLGKSIYGITTGFGGSADTRTRSLETLQLALLQMQQSGILPVQAKDQKSDGKFYDKALPNTDMMSTLSMPESWVRSAMLIRANSIVRGHSGVRLEVIQKLLALLDNNYIPLVPLRGSISASGDLSPLSYIAGALEGNPDIMVWAGEPTARVLIPADKAMAQLGLEPVVFAAKEGLGLLNGTAVSAGVATLALHEADQLAVLSQVLTAMGVEAMLGDASSFDPFIAQVRPHEGQTEAAHNILSFLGGSKLAGHEDPKEGHLRQDRYGLRTSSQWIGPQLEDLSLAHKQLTVELNSTTDNPLIDVRRSKTHHGGNFQAVSCTSATEKTRLALQMIGRMLFAQSSELLDTSLNNGLPPNLAADEPSTSYTMKGIDINMAAYMSELAFLAAPVSNHVMPAEMQNQGINSMALVSARYTHTAIDVLSLMCSAHLYVLCQALDLRAMHLLFLQKLKPAVEAITAELFPFAASIEELHAEIWTVLMQALTSTRTKDSQERFLVVGKQASSILIYFLSTTPRHHLPDSVIPLQLLQTWTTRISHTSRDIFVTNREEYMEHPDATKWLGRASKKMYGFVRKELNVPFHRGIRDHPVKHEVGSVVREEWREAGHRTTGGRVSVIYRALRQGRVAGVVMECLEGVGRGEERGEEGACGCGGEAGM